MLLLLFINVNVAISNKYVYFSLVSVRFYYIKISPFSHSFTKTDTDMFFHVSLKKKVSAQTHLESLG